MFMELPRPLSLVRLSGDALMPSGLKWLPHASRRSARDETLAALFEFDPHKTRVVTFTYCDFRGLTSTDRQSFRMQAASTSGARVDEMETIFERGQNEHWYLLLGGQLHKTVGRSIEHDEPSK
jgi:hypothetical protein